MPTIQVPPGQPSTPPVALVVRAELLPAEPSKISIDSTQRNAYAIPLPNAPTRSNPLSDFSGPWPRKTCMKRHRA